MVWLLALTTAFALWPWLLLRRVPITVERPSDHAAIVHLDHDVDTTIGTTRAISRHPLIGWHHFAVVPPAAGRDGYRMVVSRAGDWTGAFVDDPPDHVWVRGLPAVGVANVRRLFDKVVFVVTGSGIGPALSHLLADEMPTKLVWVTREPRHDVRRRVRRRGPARPTRRPRVEHRRARQARRPGPRLRPRSSRAAPRRSCASPTRPSRGRSSTASSSAASRRSGRSGTPESGGQAGTHCGRRITVPSSAVRSSHVATTGMPIEHVGAVEVADDPDVRGVVEADEHDRVRHRARRAPGSPRSGTTV